MGVKEIMSQMGVTNCVEMDWGQSYEHLTPHGTTIEIVFTPAKHWTSRSLFDRYNCSSFSAFCELNSTFTITILYFTITHYAMQQHLSLGLLHSAVASEQILLRRRHRLLQSLQADWSQIRTLRHRFE
jgi:hypothetical protein